MEKALTAGQRILKPPARGAQNGELLAVDGMRILNRCRLTKIYVCGNPKLRAAALDAGNELPWANVRSVPHEDLVAGRKISDGHFVLLVDYQSSGFDDEEFRNNNPNAVVVLLAASRFIGSMPPREAEGAYPYVKKADFVFYFDDTENALGRVIPAAIRCAEDRINIEKYSVEKRFVFLVVDPEPRWFSQFLPALYRIIGQRADVAIARTYEKAEEFMRLHGDKIVCLITDTQIPRAGAMGPHGRELASFAKSEYPRFPVIIASESEEAGTVRDTALVISRMDTDSLGRLERCVRDFTGMGDFLVYDGNELKARASTLAELRDVVAKLQTELLESIASHDYFSTWAYMHGFNELGDFLRPRQDRGEMLRDVLVRHIDNALLKAENERFEFKGEDGRVAATAGSARELAARIAEADISIIELCSNTDAFSTWLMRKGHNGLADDLRPLHGEGEALRRELLEIFARHGIIAQ